MRKWIFISASLLPMFFIGCTEHSLDSEILSKEDVLINFSAGYTVDYDIDVVPEDIPPLFAENTRATVAATQRMLGIAGVAAAEDDADVDCLYGLTGESFCYNMYNAEYKGKLDGDGNFVGAVTPVDKLPRVFPIEERSAVAVYAYYPYQDEFVVGDTSCYVKLDLIKEHMLTDYAYTGKIFKTKRSYGKNDNIMLGFKHAFAQVKLTFESDRDIYVDSLRMGISKNGVGLFDLKNGKFYPETSDEENISYSYDINEIRNNINGGTTKKTETVMYIPPTVPLKDLRIVYRKRGGTITVARTLTFENELTFEQGKEYSISVKLNVSPEIYN